MNTWRITKPLPPKTVKRRRARRERTRCDCGKLAVTRKVVKVGPDGQYRVVLRLCAECLEVEEEFSDGIK